MRLHLSFQCVCGQHPDTGRMLMPSVNAALVLDKKVVLKTSKKKNKKNNNNNFLVFFMN